jgi:transcriptional regulator with XRE-family HTH domain
MPLNARTGSRIRERRALAGMRQADLAREAGVSASYLNLIEHNRRNVSGEVLARIAGALGVSVQALGGVGEADTVAALREAAAAGAVPVEAERAEDFVGRFPGWAALVASQHRRLMQLETAVEALSDRMTQDPHLSASLHELLSAAASVRSTAAILADTPDIEPDWRDRFQRNLAADSARLALGAEALVGYLDGVSAPETGITAPQEEFEAWAQARGWHLPALEGGAAPDTLLEDAAELASRAAQDLARRWLAVYARDAAALPLAPLQAALDEIGLHPWRLAGRFGADPAAMLRRLAVMPGSGAGLVVCDGSGTLVFRKPVPGFALPRFGAACPLWPLYDALSRPSQPIRARVVVAGRQASGFDAWAWCEQTYAAGFDAPAVLRAHMLIVPAPDHGEPARAVGTSCRICPRAGCVARREAPIMAEGA